MDLDGDGASEFLLPRDLVNSVAACVRHLVASFDNFAHRRAHSLPGTNLPQVFAKMKADTAANTPNPVDPTLDTSNLAPDPDTPTPTIVELTENDDWIDDQDSASLKSWQ